MTAARGSPAITIPAGALGCAALMIAYQVASKAARDTLFLSSFDFARLPVMVAAASAISIGVALLATRAIARHGPARVIPAGFGASAVLTVGEWWLATRNVGVAAVVVYLHVAALAPALLSGFWSILTERLEPRSAKREIGRIAGFGTLGGLLGGVVAERITAWNGVVATLPVLALAHAFCAWLLFRMFGSAAASSPAGGDLAMSASQAARRLVATSYLRNLALLIVGTSVSAVLLDFVFKAQVTRAGTDLMRVFSAFYTLVALCTFAIQTLATRATLERAGLPRAIGALPGSVVVGGIAAALVPGVWGIGVARGLEAVLRGSLFRAGYEVLYAPIPPAEKRATKTLVDVGCDRLGEAIGAGVTMAVLVMSPRGAPLALLASAVIIALVMLMLVTRLQRGYVMSLEAGLRAGSLNLATLEVDDATTRDTLQRTLGGIDIRSLRMALSSPPVDRHATTAASDDAVAQSMRDLRSGDPARARGVLVGAPALDPTLVPQAIQLLAWDEVAQEAFHALRRVAVRHAGQLVDALIDPGNDFVIRRRIPALLAGCPGARVAAGLMQGLADERFEVRFRCARALSRVLERHPDLPIDRDRVFGAIQYEAAVGRKVWDAQRVLDRLGDLASEDAEDELLRERAGRSLDHVFALLSLVLPREPLRIAYRGLHAGDPLLRGTALEYLESVLPQAVRGVLWPYLDTEGASRKAAPRPVPEQDTALRNLLDSSQSIEISLEALRKRRPNGA